MQSAKTLHIARRKEELRRIEIENLKIAQKIFSIKPSFRVSDLDRDYTDRKKLLKGMRRIHKKRIPILDGRGGALPPINAPATHSTVNERSKEQLIDSMSPKTIIAERAQT